jgi:hypothetical protein
MPDEPLDIDGWIAALEGRIAVLQEAVASLKKTKEALGNLPLTANGIRGTRGPNDVQRDQFTGLSIAEAAAEYLRIVGRPARSTDEITDAIRRGGLQRVSLGSVATILIRGHNSNGPVVRVQKGLWGLADWYPKRPARIMRVRIKSRDESEGD